MWYSLNAAVSVGVLGSTSRGVMVPVAMVKSNNKTAYNLINTHVNACMHTQHIHNYVGYLTLDYYNSCVH